MFRTISALCNEVPLVLQHRVKRQFGSKKKKLKPDFLKSAFLFSKLKLSMLFFFFFFARERKKNWTEWVSHCYKKHHGVTWWSWLWVPAARTLPDTAPLKRNTSRLRTFRSQLVHVHVEHIGCHVRTSASILQTCNSNLLTNQIRGFKRAAITQTSAKYETLWLVWTRKKKWKSFSEDRLLLWLWI